MKQKEEKPESSSRAEPEPSFSKKQSSERRDRESNQEAKTESLKEKGENVVESKKIAAPIEEKINEGKEQTKMEKLQEDVALAEVDTEAMRKKIVDEKRKKAENHTAEDEYQVVEKSGLKPREVRQDSKKEALFEPKEEGQAKKKVLKSAVPREIRVDSEYLSKMNSKIYEVISELQLEQMR